MVLLTAISLLVAAPSVRADPGSAGESTPAGAAQSPSAADAQANPADAPGHSGEAPGQAADGPGNSGDAPGHDPNGPGNSENAPGHQADQGTSIDQEATASASSDQGNVDNTHVTVRVDEPGDGNPVGQENRAEAEADGATSATAEAPGEATVTQQVHADSSATQSDASNTVVSVRVGSPGDDGAVSQANVATAGATASGDPGAVEAAEASATQSGVANTSVSVRVFSPGDDGPITQLNAASAVADTAGPGGAEATATQDGARNTSVSIRVESPGGAAPVSQSSEATAEVGTPLAEGSEFAVAVANDGLDTLVAVVVDGDDLDRPGEAGLEVWEWDWVWERDESEGLEALLGTTVGSWNWTWDGTGHGTVTTRAAGDNDRQGGSWEWTWEWDRQGVDGWSWQWEWNETLSCGTCIWIWNWSWGWSGEPTASSAQAAGNGDGGNAAAGQVNMVRADAEASAVAQTGQTASQDGSGSGTQYAGQLIEVAQTAEADATAVQFGVGSASSGDAMSQANVVTSVAAAILETAVAQDVEQVLLAGDLTTVDQWSGQQVDIAQIVHAVATASQHDAVLTRSGEHGAFGQAVAGSAADVEQLADQAAIVDAGSLSQSVAQLTLVEQAADASATVAQTGTARSTTTGGTASASASAGGLAHVDQAADQAALRNGGTGIQDAAQLAYVSHEASAHATTAQQAGVAGNPRASSDATAVDRSWIAQAAAQSSLGSSDELQESLQESIVVQRASATSTSNGGIAGAAVVVNCAVTQQGAVQSIGSGRATAAAPDLTSFCFSPTAGSPSQYSAPPVAGAPASLPTDVPADVVSVAAEEEPTLFRGRGSAAAPPRATRVARRSAPTAPHHGTPALGRPVTTLSVPPSTQARFDTRPGSPAGAGDAGREPPLPPAGDPPVWVSALAAAASGTGPTGIAAILLAFVLVPPVLLRAREGSVVRRPTGVLAPLDVPV